MNKKPDRIRLFLAVPLSSDILGSLVALRKNHDISCLDHSRWVPEQNLHVTVHFIGNILLEDLELLEKRLSQVIPDHSSFLLEFFRFEYRDPQAPRMLWARFHEHESFEALSRAAIEASAPFRLDKSEARKKAIPHITVARMRSGRPPQLPADIALPGLRVSQVELWRSDLGPGHAVYTPLAAYPLQKPAVIAAS